MARHYRTYTNENFHDAVAKAFSISGLLRELGLVIAGGNFDHMRRLLQQLNADTSHWTGKAWNKGKQLKDWSAYKNGASLKFWLIVQRGHACEECNLHEWLDGPIPLELHHIDGDRTNNSEVNLQLLCPNCHARTPNFRGKACRRDAIVKVCLDCTKPIAYRSTRCVSCASKVRIKHIHSRHERCCECGIGVSVKSRTGRCRKCHGHAQPTKIAWPSHEDLLNMVKSSSYLATGRALGVSDNAVRKRLVRRLQS